MSWTVPESGFHEESVATVSGTTSFAATPYAINPGLGIWFQWLAAIAAAAELYDILHFEIVYIPSSGYGTSTQLGLCCMFVDPDFQDTAPNSFQSCENMDGSVTFVPVTGASIKVDMSNLPVKHMFVRNANFIPLGRDPSLTDAGLFWFATYGQTSTNPLGEIRFRYRFRFHSATSLNSSPSAGTGINSHFSYGSSVISTGAAATPLQAGTQTPTTTYMFGALVPLLTGIYQHSGSAIPVVATSTSSQNITLTGTTMTLNNLPAGMNVLVMFQALGTATCTFGTPALTSGATALKLWCNNGATGALGPDINSVQATGNTTTFNAVMAFTVSPANPTAVVITPAVPSAMGTDCNVDVFVVGLNSAFNFDPLLTPTQRLAAVPDNVYLAGLPIPLRITPHLMLPSARVVPDENADWHDDAIIRPAKDGMWPPSVFPRNYRRYMMLLTSSSIDDTLTFDAYMTANSDSTLPEEDHSDRKYSSWETLSPEAPIGAAAKVDSFDSAALTLAVPRRSSLRFAPVVTTQHFGSTGHR